MPSPNDNISIKDGLAALFKMRTKDTSAAQDGSLQNIRHLATQYPVDYGSGGCFQLCSKSGVMAAGLAASSPIYSFRWTSATLLAIVRRVRIQAWSLGTGFTAGIATFDMFRAVAWTVADTGGVLDTITTPNGSLRSAMTASALTELRHSSTAALTAGTRTRDVQPADSMTYGVLATANTPFSPTPSKLFERVGSEHPLVLATNEGFTIQATVPATGTWSWLIIPEWDEVPIVNY
jgi:hypothetical protein